MENTIMYKYFLEENGVPVAPGLWHVTLQVNKDFEYRSFGISEGMPCIWGSTAGGDQAQKEIKVFIVFTGVGIPVATQFLKYLATVTIPAGYVFHLWQDFR